MTTWTGFRKKKSSKIKEKADIIVVSETKED